MRLPHRVLIADFAHPLFREGVAEPATPIPVSWLNANIIGFYGVTVDCLITFENATDVSQQTPNPVPRFYVGQRRFFALVRNQAIYNLTTSLELYSDTINALRDFRNDRVRDDGWTINRTALASNIATKVFASDYAWTNELGVFPDPDPANTVNPFQRATIGRARQIAGYGVTNVRNPNLGRGCEVAVVSQAGPNTIMKLELSYDRL